MHNALNDFTDRDHAAANHRLLIANQFKWELEKAKQEDFNKNAKAIINLFLVCFLFFLLALLIICLPVIIQNN